MKSDRFLLCCFERTPEGWPHAGCMLERGHSGPHEAVIPLEFGPNGEYAMEPGVIHRKGRPVREPAVDAVERDGNLGLARTRLAVLR